jgi:glycosyltransferase involved in cell wall biosynthesis
MARALHVCFVTPGHLSTNPRLVKEADTVTGRGGRVSVVSGRFLPWAMQTDSVFRSRPWHRVEVPFGPHAGRGNWIGQSLRRHSSRLAGRLTGAPRLREVGLHPALPELEQAAAAIGADLYVAHNLAALPAAANAARVHGSAYAFDAEDDHVDELPDTPGAASERRLRDEILRAYLPGAAFVTASSPMIAAALGQRYGRAFTVIHNVFPLADAAGLTEPHALPAPRFYWFSQTIGPDRGLEEWLRIASCMRGRTRLCLRGDAQPGFAPRLAAAAAAFGLPADTIEWLPVIDPEQAVRSCAGYAGGLGLETETTANHRRCLSNKVFSYLLAGTPAVLSSTPAQVELSATLGAATVLVDLARPQESADRLDAWLADDSRWLASARAAWRVARERYNWDREKDAFVRLLADCGVLARAGAA